MKKLVRPPARPFEVGTLAQWRKFEGQLVASVADVKAKLKALRPKLPRDLATLLAAQTTLGAAKVALETGHHPALLKDEVTTPAGCTIDGIMELEEGRLRVTLIKAVVKAAQRARELLFKDSAVGA